MRRSIKAGMLVAPTAVALTVAFIAQVATGEQVSGSTADICRWPAPCKADETYGHPGDCAAYSSCDIVSSSFIPHKCPGDQKFDRENGTCVDPVIARCTVSCPDTVAPVVVSDVTSVVETVDAGRNATTMGAPKTKPSTTTTTTTTTTPQPTTTTTPTTTTLSTTKPTTTPRITTKRTTTTTPTTTTKRTTTSSTTTTTTTTSTTPPPTTTVPPSTTRRTPTPLVIHVGDTGKEAKPGYVAVSTLSPPANTSGAGTAGKGMSGGTIGVIAGTVGGVVVILVVLIVLLIILLRRRKRKNRQRIPKIENPHYRNAQPQSYRFSRDSTLYVGNTVNLQTTNNNTAIGSKKNDTSPDGSLSKQKRKAPPPPNPFGTDSDYLKVNNHALTDIYEKDSHASSENIELGTFSARNYQASSDAIADDDDDDHRTGPSAPLIDKHADASESAHSESDSGAGSDEEKESSNGSESARSSSSESGSESEDADEASQTSDKMPLAKSVDSAGRSLDEYDKTRNPFIIS